MSLPRTSRALLFQYITLVFLPLLAFSLAAAQKNSKPTARILIDKTRHDFGQVFAGEVLTCIFTVRNVGGTTLEMAESTTTAPPTEEKPPSKVRPSGTANRAAARMSLFSGYLEPRRAGYKPRLEIEAAGWTIAGTATAAAPS